MSVSYFNKDGYTTRKAALRSISIYGFIVVVLVTVDLYNKLLWVVQLWLLSCKPPEVSAAPSGPS